MDRRIVTPSSIHPPSPPPPEGVVAAIHSNASVVVVALPNVFALPIFLLLLLLLLSDILANATSPLLLHYVIVYKTSINKLVRQRDIFFSIWGCNKTLNSQFREAPEFKMSIGEAW
jgi:hypothetical protein